MSQPPFRLSVRSQLRAWRAAAFTIAAALLLPAGASGQGQQPSVQLEQCRNGAATAPLQCAALAGGNGGWVTGNVGAQQSHYVEGFSVPYRAVMNNLPVGQSVRLDIGYDVRESGRHAIDFLTHYQRLESHLGFGHPAETVSPTSGVTGVSALTTTFAVPTPSTVGSPTPGQPATRFASLSAGERVITLFGGTITDVTYLAQGSLTDAASETRVRITFTPASANAVLAWGGHIARSADWGVGNAAAGIGGSPYHMRLIDWNLGNLGNQDRSLAAGAVLPTGTLVVRKTTVGGDGTFRFSGTGIGIAQSFDLTTSAGTAERTFTEVPVGDKALTEVTPLADRWSFTSLACVDPDGGTTVAGTQASVDLDIGETVTCTYTNTKHPSLRLQKTVVNDNGGTATAADFQLTADGAADNDVTGAGSANSPASLLPDTFTLSESGPDGYQAGGWVCDGGTQNGSQITLAAGQDATCTVINNDAAPSLTLNKVVRNDNGGTAPESAWRLTATLDGVGPATVAGPGAPGDTDVTSGPQLLAGTYILNELGGPGGYGTLGWTCIGNAEPMPNVATVTVGLGEDVVCTIVNDDLPPSLTLDKIVINDNGGTAVESDWTLTAAGPTTLSGPGEDGDSDVASEATFAAGTYALSESGPGGYAGTWECEGANLDAQNHIVVSLGAVVTCTVTNDDRAPKLTLNKVVVNDNGGTAGEAEWVLTATRDGAAVPVLAGSGASGAADVTSQSDFTTGTYLLAESTGPAGYMPSAWVCDGGVQEGALITITLGQDVTCTITNDDVGPSLTLIKEVVNDNGSSAVPSDWRLSATTTGGAQTVVAEGDGTASAADLQAGTYTLQEVGPTTHQAGAWTCDGAQPNGNQITLDIGQSATCRITNDDRAPSLTLKKRVVNDNGGTADVAEWDLTATGPSVLSGADGVSSGPDFQAGTYTLTEENGPGGYAATGWTCVGGSQNGDAITLDFGDEATCTITNDDIEPQLLLIKKVVNDNGGTGTPADATLTATGSVEGNEFSGTGDVSSADANIDLDNNGRRDGLRADTFKLHELMDVPGYVASDWICNGQVAADNEITVTIGDAVTCTITNDDAEPSLTLVKRVVNDNGGTAVAADWTLSADGPTPISGAGGAVSTTGFTAGSYVLSESIGVNGYVASAWSCDGGEMVGETVTLALGQSATCTITNDDAEPSLTLIKRVVNDNGGTAVPADWTLSAAGPTSFEGQSGVISDGDFSAGTYELAEAGGLPGYAASAWSCEGAEVIGGAVTLGLGQSATCTIVNDDIAPVLRLRKSVINDNGGTATTDDFVLRADGAGGNDVSGTDPVDSGATLIADTFDLSETQKHGYVAGEWACSGDGVQAGSQITLGIGQQATCTIVNDDQPGTIIIQKITKPAGTGQFSFSTTGAGFDSFTLAGGSSNTQAVDAGTYTVTEVAQNGWILTGLGGSADPNTPFSCDVSGSTNGSGTGDLSTGTATITVGNGDTVSCTYENTGQGVTRTQGFWQTHPQLAELAWFGGTGFGHTFPGVANTSGIGDRLICGRSVDTLGKVMGGFWSNIARTTTDVRRSSLDQARMQLLQQLLAAELNASAFGSLPLGGAARFAQWEAALCGTSTSAIRTAQGQAAAFNEMGDAGDFTPGASAQAKLARSLANLPFWNVVKP